MQVASNAGTSWLENFISGADRAADQRCHNNRRENHEIAACHA